MKYFTVFLLFLILCDPGFAQKNIVASNPTLEDRYPKKFGSIRFSASKLALGRILNNEIRMDTIRCMNIGNKAIHFSLGTPVPSHLSIQIGQAILEPNSTGWISVAYNAPVKNDYGFTLDQFILNTDDSVMPVKTLYITASIAEYFPPLTSDDSLRLPIARTGSLMADYGRVRQGEKVERDFVIYNDGKGPLILHKSKAACTCINTSIQKNSIAPGDSSVVHVQFNTAGREGRDAKRISVFVNAPNLPEIKLELSGEIYK